MIPVSNIILDEEEINAVQTVLQSGLISQGEVVDKFEQVFAEFIGTKYAIAVNSGTSALHIALLANGIGYENEVITTPFTFIASANSILFTGAKPSFADIEEDTFNINPDSICKKISFKTKAIMPVHIYGQPCDMGRITLIAKEYGLKLIEDACQAHGAEYNGIKVGSFGTGCFSFYATKNMTTSEGGMITTNDKEIAEIARMIRNHGQKGRYYHEILGFNYRMTDIAAAIGICQLRKLGPFNNKRIENARFLTQNLTGIKGLTVPQIKPDVKHVFHQYTVRITKDFGLSRDELGVKLKDKNIETRIYYPLPVHRQPVYRDLGYNDHLPVSEKAASEVLSLPVNPALVKEDLDYIVKSLSDCQMAV